MNKIKLALFVILGILATISMVYPTFILKGLSYGIDPRIIWASGIMLKWMPTVFVYYSLALGLGFALTYFKIPFPTLIALIFVIISGFWASLLLNIPIYNKVNQYANQDIELAEKFEIPSIMAFDDKNGTRYPDICGPLCQRLLYNGIAQKILIIGVDPSVVNNNLNKFVISFEIQQRKNCADKYTGKFSSPAVKSRMAAGECIVKSKAQISEAEAFFFSNKVNVKAGHEGYKKRVIVDYIQLLKQSGGKFETIYRYSEIKAKTFAYPLSYGASFDATGGSWSLDKVFFPSSKYVNNSDGRLNVSPETNALFAEAQKPIQPAEIDRVQLIEDALENDSIRKLAGLDMIDDYLGDLYIKKTVPTDEDMQLVIRTLRNSRATEWSNLVKFTSLWRDERGSVPPEFAQALADRILRQQQNIEEAASAISNLPEGDAAVIHSELEKIAKDKALRGRAYNAITRLGDVGEQAVPKYLEIMKEYKMARKGKIYFTDPLYLTNLGTAARASIIGLCLLGGDAIAAKDVLFKLVAKARPSLTGRSKLAVNALIEMGLYEELQKRHEYDERKLREIEKIFSKRERKLESYKKAGKTGKYCSSY